VTPDADPEFRVAVGMTRPVHLRVAHADAGVLAEGPLDQPFAVVGSDPACEIAVNDPALPARAACLQIIDGTPTVFPFDTLAPIPLTPSGWTLGRFTLSATDPPAPPDPDAGTGPRLTLGLSTGGTWAMTGRIAFLGTAAGCTLRLDDPDVAPVHAYLLKAGGRAWVVDVTAASGTWVNGRAVRAAELHDGDDLWVRGVRLRVTCDPWGDIAPMPPGSRSAAILGREEGEQDLTPGSLRSPPPLHFGEGVFGDPLRIGGGGERSEPGEVSGDALTPRPPLQSGEGVRDDLIALTPIPAAADPAALAAIQQMMTDFRKSMDELTAAFEHMRRDHEAMTKELARLSAQTAELQSVRPRPGPLSADHPAFHPLPPPETDTPIGEADDRYQWVASRLAAMEAERADIWTRLRGLFGRPVG
jgi:hypothetical protein